MNAPLFPYGQRRTVTPKPSDALTADNLAICYACCPCPALRDLNLRVPAGSHVALVGANGAGKSTLLKAAAGLLPVAGGALRIFGDKVGACPCRVAYLPQRGDIDWRFPISVERLVLTGRYVHLGWFRRPGARDREIARETIARLGLSHLAQRQIGQLSGGQQQRALVARALTQAADLLLLDEPLNAVDAETRDIIDGVLIDLKRQGATVIVATHDANRSHAFDQTIQLREGRQIASALAPAVCGECP